MKDNRMYEERTRRRLTLMDVALRAGCSVATLTFCERYGYVPRRTGTRARIAAAIGVPARELWPTVGEDETIPRLRATVEE